MLTKGRRILISMWVLGTCLALFQTESAPAQDKNASWSVLDQRGLKVPPVELKAPTSGPVDELLVAYWLGGAVSRCKISSQQIYPQPWEVLIPSNGPLSYPRVMILGPRGNLFVPYGITGGLATPQKESGVKKFDLHSGAMLQDYVLEEGDPPLCTRGSGKTERQCSVISYHCGQSSGVRWC